MIERLTNWIKEQLRKNPTIANRSPRLYFSETRGDQLAQEAERVYVVPFRDAYKIEKLLGIEVNYSPAVPENIVYLIWYPGEIEVFDFNKTTLKEDEYGNYW